MSTARADQYWRETFGLSRDQFNRPGILVCPHSQKLAGRNASWIFVHDDTCIISVPPRLVGAIESKTTALTLADIMTGQSLAILFGDRIGRTIGPAYQGCIEKGNFRPVSSKDVRALTPADSDSIGAFAGACDPSELRDSGIDFAREPLFGCFRTGDLVAVAGVIPWAPYAANLGILVHSDHRNQGLGTVVASAAVQHVLDEGNVVLYQTLMTNRAAVRIAECLGCTPYARTLYVGFREAD